MLAIVSIVSVVCCMGPLAAVEWQPVKSGDVKVAQVRVSGGPVCTVQVACDKQGDQRCQVVTSKSGCVTIEIGGSGLNYTGVVPAVSTVATAGGPVWVMAGDDDEKIIDLSAFRVDEPKAWLGVRMAPVPDALKAHIGRGGLMIGNVVEGSPADEAGLERYDVFVSFDGQAIEEMEDLLEAISEAGEDAKVKLVIVHGGEEQKVRVTLGARPTGADFAYKYEEEEKALLDDQFTFRGHRLSQGPQGWVFEPLGRLKDLPEPFKGIRSFSFDIDDNDHTFIFTPHADGGFLGENEITIKIVQDGEVIEIRRSKDGEVTVTRTDEDGETSSTTYDSIEELEEEDPGAFKHLGRGHFAGGKGLRWIYRAPNSDELPKLQRRFQTQIELKLDGVQERLLEVQKKAGRAGEEAHRVMRRWVDKQTEESEQVDITIDGDGAIRVVVESGDTRIVYEFKSKNEFKKSEPELYERFRGALE